MSSKGGSGFAPRREERPKRVRVLLVEDNPSDAHLLQDLLRTAWGGEFEIDWVDRIGLAVERLRAAWADVLLLDLTLPDSDGLETVLTARAAAPSLPIIVLSGLADMEVANNAFRAGVHDYLVKDKMSREVLLRSLRYAIERADLQASLLQRTAEMAALLVAIPDTVFKLSRGGAVEVFKSADPDPAPESSIGDLLPAEGAAAVMARLGEVLAGGEPGEVTYRALADASEHVAHVARCTPDDAIVVLRRSR